MTTTILPRSTKRPAGLPRPASIERTSAFGNHVQEWALSVEGQPARVVRLSDATLGLSISEVIKLRRLGVGRSATLTVGGAAALYTLTRIA